jgi:RNA polymerase sigma-70 factor (ECF subfamily)
MIRSPVTSRPSKAWHGHAEPGQADRPDDVVRAVPTTPPVLAAARGPDADLVDRLRAGDEAAFAAVVDDWSPGMLRVARTFVSTTASAEDVVQDTWVAVVRGLAAFEGRSSLRTWTYRILVNVARTRATRERRTTPLSSLLPLDDEGPTVGPDRFRPADAAEWPGWWHRDDQVRPWPPTPEAGAMAAEMRRVLAAALADLPDRQRVVVTLRDVEGFGSHEVCLMLGLTLANQRVLLHRARAKLRAALDAYLDPTADDPSAGPRGDRVTDGPGEDPA